MWRTHYKIEFFNKIILTEQKEYLRDYSKNLLQSLRVSILFHPMFSLKKIFFTIFGILLLGLLSAAYYFSSLVLYPNVRCSKEHHVFCETPGELGLPYEVVSFPTEDGLNLEAYYIQHNKTNKSILLVHGHGGQKNEGLRFAKSLYGAGYNLLLLSLRRNHGGFASMGYHEQKDVKAALEFLESKGQTSIGIFGFSMGSATSIIAMDKNKNIKAGLFSSGYGSALDVLVESAQRDFGIPYYPLIPLVKLFINVRGDLDIESVRPIDSIGNISPRPIAIFHCDADDYVDHHHALDLFAKAKEPKSIWSPACTRHERIWNVYPKESETRAVEFFSKNLN
ncbi:alpha/beta hydrolase [Leptospira sp. 96542]|nr:alpha/beta hydrolase [Leptospira sp. 96542]